MIHVINAELFRIRKSKSIWILSIYTLALVVILNVFLKLLGDSDEVIKTFISSSNFSFVNSFFGFDAGMESIIALVFGMIILNSDFSKKRLKNYIHLVTSRTTLIVGKIIAAFTATVILEIVLMTLSAVIVGVIWGFGSLSDISWVVFLHRCIYKIITILFAVLIVAFLSILLNGSPGGVVGLLLFKDIVLVTVFATISEFTKYLIDQKWYYSFISNIYNFATNPGYLLNIREALHTGEFNKVWINVLVGCIYCVFLLLLNILYFNRKELK